MSIPAQQPADPQAARRDALAQAMGQIEKAFGRGAIMKLGDAHLAFDFALGSKRSHGVDHQNVDCRGTDKLFGNLERLLAVVEFYASVRIDIRSRTMIKDGDDVLGRRTYVKVTKNKVAPPFKRAARRCRAGI